MRNEIYLFLAFFVPFALAATQAYFMHKAFKEKAANEAYERKHGNTVMQQIKNENPLLFQAIMANAEENGRRIEEERNKRN